MGNKDLKRFFYRSLIFLLIVISLDQLCGNLLRVLYYNQKIGTARKTIDTFEKINDQILIIGSSTGENHYIPQTFEDSLNMSCYNAGRAGYFIFYYDAVLKCVLKRYKPKVIILDILSWELEKNQENYDRLAQLLPFYKNHPELHDLIALKSPYEKIKLLSAIYPYNSTLIQSATSTLDVHKKRDEEIKLKGFTPLFDTYKQKPGEVYYGNVIDSNSVNTLASFIKDCNYNGIKLFITISPGYRKIENQDSTILIAQNLAGKYNVPVWNYTQDAYFLSHPELFNDMKHLNVTGALIYSKMLASRIKASL